MGICVSLPKHEAKNVSRRHKRRVPTVDSSDENSYQGVVRIAHIAERPNDGCPCHHEHDHSHSQCQSIAPSHMLTDTDNQWSMSPMIVVDNEANKRESLDVPAVTTRESSNFNSTIPSSVSMSPTYDNNIDASPTCITSLLSSANNDPMMIGSLSMSFVSRSAAASPALKPVMPPSKHQRSHSCLTATPLSPIVAKHVCYRYSASPLNDRSPNLQPSHARTRSFSILEVLSLPALSLEELSASDPSPPSPPPIRETEIETEMYDHSFHSRLQVLVD